MSVGPPLSAVSMDTSLHPYDAFEEINSDILQTWNARLREGEPLA